MNTLQEVQEALTSLTPGEKAQLLQTLAYDLGNTSPGIDSDPAVSGGEACIIRTRIPVWILVQARILGVSEAELLTSYPTLHAEDLTNAWAYYRSHRAEIDEQIIENEAA
jgi:uncharacterized protein (DUF433 family)